MEEKWNEGDVQDEQLGSEEKMEWEKRKKKEGMMEKGFGDWGIEMRPNILVVVHLQNAAFDDTHVPVPNCLMSMEGGRERKRKR